MNPHRPDASYLVSSPYAFVALGFGCGLVPFWPGTFGATAGVLLAIPLAILPGWLATLFIAVAIAVGIRACGRVEIELRCPDASVIVWDEVVAMALVALLVPAEVVWWLIALLAFRAFDILKPWPVNLIDEKLKGGLGIMADDLAAGAYTVAAIAGIRSGIALFSG